MKEKKHNYTEQEFCMTQFKMAIIVLAVLLTMILGWEAWHCNTRHRDIQYALAATNQPMGPPIKIKDKMLHPYWGNCSKCHVTTNVGKTISKVMAGPPISVDQKMLHDYWGNCLLCHQITDGVQPKDQQPQKLVALNKSITSESLGLKVLTVNASLMQQFALPNEDGVLVVEVFPNSIAAQTGFMKGDEIIRVDKARIETTNNLDTALSKIKPNSNVKINIYRGKKSKNLYLNLNKILPDTTTGNLNKVAVQQPMTQNQIETLAEQLGVPKTQQDVARALAQQNKNNLNPVAMQQPMTQNQIETLAEQLGVPKTQQDVARALAQQNKNNLNPVALTSFYGKIAIASTGSNPYYQISNQFATTPYFIIFDPSNNTYSVAANPNINDLIGQDIQTSQYMVDLGVSGVIAGNFTPGALSTLHTLRINVYPGVTGSVQNAALAYANGQIAPFTYLNNNMNTTGQRVIY
ncbi:MAG: PDZ domain-containing protein [Desulfobacterales bacterium]|nr:PDZ domain-containing protein [Desulfobacterales bacterium]